MNTRGKLADGEAREGMPHRPRGMRAQTGLGHRQGAQAAWHVEQLGEQQEMVRLQRAQMPSQGNRVCSADGRTRRGQQRIQRSNVTRLELCFVKMGQHSIGCKEKMETVGFR